MEVDVIVTTGQTDVAFGEWSKSWCEEDLLTACDRDVVVFEEETSRGVQCGDVVKTIDVRDGA